jgi:hypothetical protein
MEIVSSAAMIDKVISSAAEDGISHDEDCTGRRFG